MNNKGPKYLPTPEEIKQWCLRIQKEWSLEEEHSRRNLLHYKSSQMRNRPGITSEPVSLLLPVEVSE